MYETMYAVIILVFLHFEEKSVITTNTGLH